MRERAKRNCWNVAHVCFPCRFSGKAGVFGAIVCRRLKKKGRA